MMKYDRRLIQWQNQKKLRYIILGYFVKDTLIIFLILGTVTSVVKFASLLTKGF